MSMQTYFDKKWPNGGKFD